MSLYYSQLSLFSNPLSDLPEKQLLITTLNAHSFNVAQRDKAFAEALQKSDVLLPDGVSVVWAAKLLHRVKNQEPGTKTEILKKIAGEDLFYWEMNRLQSAVNSQQSAVKKKVFFLGSTEEVLAKIELRAGVEFPNVAVHTYSPPYKAEFSEEDNLAMYAAINAVQPDVLFVGMTAPKQEKWAYRLVHSSEFRVDSEEKVLSTQHSALKTQKSELKTPNSKLRTPNYHLPTNCHVCCIGAVFDFYAETVKRAPKWMINIHLEWFYRLVKEPRRMWRRYLIGNVQFIWAVLMERWRK